MSRNTGEVDLDFPREWFEFNDPEDPENELWRCDLTWLTSFWSCIYGNGCEGIFKERPDDGCCSQGAHYSEKADRKRVAKWVEHLTPETWQFFDEGHTKKGKLDINEYDEQGELKTKRVEDGCIFLNRRGFAGGEGCALHHLAIREGVHFSQTKPDVCWELPIRRSFDTIKRPDDTEINVTIIGEFDRRGWGEGGHDLDWYCSGNPVAHRGTEPVYLSNRIELEAIMGVKQYQILKEICDARMKAMKQSKNLPLFVIHPATKIAQSQQ